MSFKLSKKASNISSKFTLKALFGDMPYQFLIFSKNILTVGNEKGHSIYFWIVFNFFF